LIDPEPFRNEVLAFVRSGLRDITCRFDRAPVDGIPVGDESQVVYVWFDALTNCISALDFGTDGERYQRWWRHADHRLRGRQGHPAVPRRLLAGVPAVGRQPSRRVFDPYLTIDGAKISVVGNGSTPSNSPTATAPTPDGGSHETCHRSPTPTSPSKPLAHANDDLANGIGNAVSRIRARRALPKRRRARHGAEPLTEVIGLATPSTERWPTSTGEPRRR
jgi:methionyl-tRNA synthetase